MAEIHSTDYHDFVIKGGVFIGEFEQMYRKIEDPWGTVQHVRSLKNDLLVDLIRHIRGTSTVQRILHAGCSLGALTARVLDETGPKAEVWACDISRTAVEKAGKRHPGPRFLVHDLRHVDSMPFASAFFDLVLMAETMWYVVESLDAILRRFRALLRREGHLVLQQYFPQPGEQQYGADFVASPADLVRFVGSAGFVVRHQLHVDPEHNHCFMLWATA